MAVGPTDVVAMGDCVGEGTPTGAVLLEKIVRCAERRSADDHHDGGARQYRENACPTISAVSRLTRRYERRAVNIRRQRCVPPRRVSWHRYLQCVARLSFDKNAREVRTSPRKPGLDGAASSTGLRSDLVD